MRNYKVLALAFPIVILLFGIIKSEFVIRTGEQYILKVEGYDPRDLLKGRFILFRPRLDVDSAKSSCNKSSPNCCYCFKRTSSRNPEVTRLSCLAEKFNVCDSVVKTNKVDSLRRYYIPEASADQLDKLFRTHAREIGVSVNSRGDLVINDLYIEEMPWREFLKTIK